MLHFHPDLIQGLVRGKKIPYDKIAEACYVERKTVQRWMLGKADIPAYALPALADLLGYKIDFFFSVVPPLEN